MPLSFDPIAIQPPKPSSERLDCRSSGPIMPKCIHCGKRFKLWEGKLRLLGQNLELEDLPATCIPCFRNFVMGFGFEPGIVKPSYAPWTRLKQKWKESSHEPANRTVIMLGGMTLWCSILEELGHRHFHVRVDLTATEMDAKWDGISYHRTTGRPLLLPTVPAPPPAPEGPDMYSNSRPNSDAEAGDGERRITVPLAAVQP